MSDGLIKIIDGNTFVVSDDRGDIEASATDPVGMFSYDTRFLSTWVLTIDGQRLSPLSVDDLQYFETRFFLVPGVAAVYVDASVSALRQRTICDGLCEDITITNHENQAVDLSVRIEVGCDFADLFEIKDGSAKKGSCTSRVGDGQLILSYQRDAFGRETIISTTTPVDIDERGLTFCAHIGPHEEWTTRIQITPIMIEWGGRRTSLPAVRNRAKVPQDIRTDLAQWLDNAPRLQCDWDPLKETYNRSLVDLAALRFSPRLAGPNSMPAAGLPWFMTMFGRDSILTSLQALPFTPELAATTLRVLARWQGRRLDDFREEEPGRILHEIRYGETAAFEEQPHSPYYGNADATALFVVLLDEYELWTGDADLVRQFEPQARAALNWIDQFGDLMGNGYVSYRRRNEQTGLDNQCWKDSWDSISYHDGHLPGLPRATCELQGYAYDARMRAARLARTFWDDPGYAHRLEREATDLKERFNRDFWIDARQYYALALDGENGAQVDALSSNIGHLLWSGIIDQGAKADAVIGHLMSPQLYSGWGVRTLGTSEGRYNPVGYHVGTVWPFDNSFIAWGLRRYGHSEEAARIACGILDAATFFRGRLPEAFGGYDREKTKYPVQYPTACSPQAWSSGAPLLLLRTMLGMQPAGDNLVVKPALPNHIGHLELRDVPGRWGHADAYGRGRIPVTA